MLCMGCDGTGWCEGSPAFTCPECKGTGEVARNPYLERLANAGKNAHGKKAEKKTAKKMGARLHPNSGARRGAKSDASLKNFRLEMKSTTNKVLPLDMAWLTKIAQEALPHGQTPGVVVLFVDPQGVPRLRQYAEWVLIPRVAFQELVDP